MVICVQKKTPRWLVYFKHEWPRIGPLMFMNIFSVLSVSSVDKKKSVHTCVLRGPTKHPPREMPSTHDASHLLLPEKARIKHCKWLIYRGGVAARPTLIPNALQQCASNGERYVAVRSVMICEVWKVIYPLSRSSAFVVLVVHPMRRSVLLCFWLFVWICEILMTSKPKRTDTPFMYMSAHRHHPQGLPA